MKRNIFTTLSRGLDYRWLTAVPALILAVGAAHGQAFEEITVTATKRSTTIQDVPFSINAQTQQDIQRTGATSLEDLARNVAGLSIQNLGPGQSQVAIRGVSAGQIIRDQPGVKEQVGVYFDESIISLSLFTPDFDLYDLNRVETLRGPQGTLFGSGSIGGTIRYITNAPSMDGFEGSVELDVNSITDGDTGGHIKGMVNVPLSDTAALRAVAYTTEYGGYIDALTEGGVTISDVNSGNRTGARVAITFQPSDSLTITPRLVYQTIDTDGFNRQEVFNLFANPYTTTRPAIQLGERQQYLLLREGFEDETLLADLLVNKSLDSFDVTFVGSYLDRDILVSRDASALSGSVSVNPFAGLGFPEDQVARPSNLQDRTKLQQTTFELRLSSNTDGPFQWLVGAFTSQVDRDYGQILPTPGYDAIVDSLLGPGTSAAVANGVAPPDSPFASALPYDIEQSALFGEVTYDVSDVFHLTVGGRYYDFSETRDIVFGGIFADAVDQTDKTSSDGFTPRVLASFELNDNVTLNAQASQGFRLGGVNDPLNVPLCTAEDLAIFGGITEYGDEKLWNYEAGVKSRFGNGIALNAAVFYADMEDLQVTLDAGSCSSRISFNVDKAHSSGVEVELKANPSESFEFSLAASFLSAEFDSNAVDALGNILGGVEKGNRLASVPEFQIAATGSWFFPLSWMGGSDGYLNATVQHVGDRITQPTDQLPGAGNFAHNLAYAGMTGNEVTSVDLELDPYTLINLSTGMIKDDWEAVLYVSNLTDENALLSFDRERGGRARLGYRTNQPRTIGLTYRKRFGD
jgi:outer membrane receptor protein involved in Fe transport